MGKPHVLVIPVPAQGHVIPLLELSQCLSSQGLTVTFANTKFNHDKLMNSLSPEADILKQDINFVAIPDVLVSWDDSNDMAKLVNDLIEDMPPKLEELIREINGIKKITCVIIDGSMGWALDVGKQMQIKMAAFFPPAAAVLGFGLSLPKMIDQGTIDDNGTPTNHQDIQPLPTILAMNMKNVPWTCFGDLTLRKIVFDMYLKFNKAVEMADWLICNSFYASETEVFALFPTILPVGPLLAKNRKFGETAGSLFREDLSCLQWLDQQEAGSVIYVAFGSTTVLDRTQFLEVALGLELTNRPFLWVVRHDLTDHTNDAYPQGFRERVGTRGRIVAWAPQQKVLSHPSVACFLSHCGWNSTMEGISNGVPILCWPYFGDQFLNKAYICDIWKVGLSFNRDESGTVRCEEIKGKVEQLLIDKQFKENATNLKEEAAQSVKEGGSSNKNLRNFIEWVKA